MHRSGTSCVTGLLEQAGVFLGDVATKSPWNLKGNRESSAIMAMHNELLRVNGGSWDTPPATVTWPEESRNARDAIISSYQHVPLWGFKDPRTLLVLDGWLEALPGLQLVGVFRHPVLVAESLQRRNHFPLEQGLQLWSIYNRALLAYHDRYKFPVLSFDSAPEPFTHSVALLTRVMGLPSSAAGKLDFFDPALRHVTPSGDALLPGDVRGLYLALQRIAL
jgi:hypothetical protein